MESVLTGIASAVDGNNPEANLANFAKNVAEGLKNPLLHHQSSRVKHVVYLIITPSVTWKNNSTVFDTTASFPDSSPLESFSIFVINTDEKAFESLVSQPIALTAPLLDPQYADSWFRNPADAAAAVAAAEGPNTDVKPRHWWKYKATKRDIAQNLNEALFLEWCQLCSDEDLSTTLVSLVCDNNDALDSLQGSHKKTRSVFDKVNAPILRSFSLRHCVRVVGSSLRLSFGRRTRAYRGGSFHEDTRIHYRR